MTDIEALLATYPRSRPPLSQAHRDVYIETYRNNRLGQGAAAAAAQSMESWMHRQAARVPGRTILELGAGTLNHLAFESSIQAYDVVEPMSELYADRPELGRIRNLYTSLSEVSREVRYDKIMSVAVLEHMTDLPGEIAQAALLLEPNGTFVAGIPSEGGLLWWLGWRATTGLSYWWRHGLDYEELMRHEHVNQCLEILAICRHIFTTVELRWFPLPGIHVSLYVSVRAQNPNLDHCRDVLRNTNR